jgi:uncharacterized protein YjeT (DUF2065 family)
MWIRLVVVLVLVVLGLLYFSAPLLYNTTIYAAASDELFICSNI